MSRKSSPNRRRSIAVLGHGSVKTSSRRRAYSIAPGERLSPAAKARRLLAPRKSILKASINLPQSGRSSDATESGISGSQDDTNNVTQSMDLTEVHGGPRKSLSRRVSFAAHTHVRLFHKPSPDSRSPSDSSGSSQPATAFITRAENDENAVPGPYQPHRRSSFRRRSSGVYSEYGERSMDMDMDDTAPLPEDFLSQNREAVIGSAIDEDWSADEGDSSDMEVTEAIALNIERKRSLSLGGNRASLGEGLERRRSSIVGSAQHHNQNPLTQQEHTIQGEGNSFEHADEEPTTSSAHTGSSFMSEGSSGEPMEFTIPVLPSMRQPQEPDPLWLQLRAMTHAGHEPYEPPPPESDDDAVMIQPSPGHANYVRQSYGRTASEEDDGGEQDMDLTSAMSRLQQARASLGLGAPTLDQEDSSFSEEEHAVERQQEPEAYSHDDTFSTEDSFGDETADMDNQTINFTQRTSLGTLDSSMDETDVHDGVVRVPITPGIAQQPSLLPAQPSTEATEKPAAAENPELRPLFAPAAEAPLSSVFTPPVADSAFRSTCFPPLPTTTDAVASSVMSATSEYAARLPSSDFLPLALVLPSKSPGPATVPKPFNFNLPRSASPSKIPVASNGPAHQSYRGTAAFAPPTVPKSPKRPAVELPEAGADGPGPAKRLAIGRQSLGRSVSFALPDETTTAGSAEPVADSTSQPAPGATGNRRSSMVRRPAGYFAQRKSLAAGALPSQGGPAGLRPRASMGSQPSSTTFTVPLTRTHSDPGLANGAGETEGGTLYPNLSRLVSSGQVQRAASPSLTAGETPSQESTRQAAAAPSPANGSLSPALPRVVSPAPPQPAASPAPAAGPSRDRPVTHIEKPQPHIIDVSMAIEDTSIADGNAGVSQAWRESVPEETSQDDDGPAISIEQFFQMTGIRFMDELTMPKPRRSTVLPGQLRPRARRRSSTATHDLAVSSGSAMGEGEEAIPLAEFAVSMAVDMPRLDLYAAVTRDLTAYIQECKKIYREAEEEALKVTPSLFKEFASVDETEQSMLIHQLKLIKANNIGTAKSQWYDWKLQWVEQLYESAAQGFSNLESDATYLAGVIKEAQDILPALREDTEIEAFRADVSEAKAKLERLDEKLAEIEAQKEEATTAIAQAKHVIHIQKESTSSEVFRLKDELEALQDLHLWQPLKHTADLVDFVYASKYHVSLPCRKYKPILGQTTITRTKQAKLKERDAFPHFTDLIVRTARTLIADSDEKLELKQVLERLGDFWSSCAQLRSQLTFLGIKYPLVVESIVDEKDQTYLQATATVMFPSAKGKAFISFLFDKETYSRWPLSVRSLKSDVQVAYGAIEYVHLYMLLQLKS
ncbi:hypothetical protein BN946_scf184672.g10 [Trametes cinnabarina]|uniref:Spc7 kinetochore protein domain-containing protein n=1 Tax=Pycnoporus cinnabarinus TaxID=5643 RepID=A0A060SMZ6_PYCCI|nr:hypothetical protein BN946_scf184672.g10 [Trametes cinnabarina]